LQIIHIEAASLGFIFSPTIFICGSAIFAFCPLYLNIVPVRSTQYKMYTETMTSGPYLIDLQNQIEEYESTLAFRAEAIKAMLQLQNKDRVAMQRLIELRQKLSGQCKSVWELLPDYYRQEGGPRSAIENNRALGLHKAAACDAFKCLLEATRIWNEGKSFNLAFYMPCWSAQQRAVVAMCVTDSQVSPLRFPAEEDLNRFFQLESAIMLLKTSLIIC